MPVQTGSPPSLVSRAATEIIYDSLPDPLPVSLTSQNFQARRAAEFGQQIQFAGTDRALDVVTIGMVTWGYYSKYFQVGTPGDSWTHPVTLNVYAVNLDDSPGTLLASITKTVDVPWRAEPNGAKCQYPLWFADADQRCHNGMAFTISFDFTSIALTLPDKVIFGVAFNTQSAGASPYGIDGPYNDLAVGFSPAITVGTSPVAPQSYLNSSANDAYADGGLGGTNYFRLDVGSDEPAIAIKFGPEPEGPGELVGVSPASAMQGDTLTVQINGQGTHFGLTSTVAFSGSDITVDAVTFVSTTLLRATLTVDLAAAVGPRDVTVTTGAEVLTDVAAFAVIEKPTASLGSVNPGTGAQGDSLSMRIDGLNTHFDATSVLAFASPGIVPSNVVVVSPLILTATVDIDVGAATGSFDVTVTTGPEVADGALFTVIQSAQKAEVLREAVQTYLRQVGGMGGGGFHAQDPVYVAVCEQFIANVNEALRTIVAGKASRITIRVGTE